MERNALFFYALGTVSGDGRAHDTTGHMANRNLSEAKKAKQDEFYTQMNDIQTEINAYLDYDENTFRGKTVLLPCDDPEWSNFTLFFAQNFERLGLKKLISTSYAPESKTAKYGSLFAYAASQSDETPKNERGKIFVLDHDVNANGRIDFEDLEWEYLKGDGDFRSEEVRQLHDEADVIVTNPPFSMFREFLAWIMDDGDSATKNTKKRKGKTKQFLIIGNMNAITYKEVFPLIKENKAWLGATGFVTDMVFRVPEWMEIAPADRAKAARLGYAGSYTRLGNSCWFTNLEHGRRHKPLQLMTMAQNIKHSKHKEVRGIGYRRYDNYDAIEVPFTDAIPSDYDGVMGVPISFLDKYCPEQFEIVGVAKAGAGDPALKTKTYPEQIQVARDGRETTVTKLNDGPVLKISDPPKNELYYKIGTEMFVQAYARILIRRKHE